MKKNSELQKFKVLIVDDVPKNIQLVANFLTQDGYEVNFALDGKKAIEHAARDNFDLILLDIMMPEVDGFEVCKQLKDDPITSSIPVIFLTAKTDEDSITRGFDVGGVDYIAKPFNPQELLARVKTHINLTLREQELKNLNQTKDTFLSIIGHDIKTPVANIVSLGELLMSSADAMEEEQKNELLSDIVESGRQGIWLLENLLSWTRIQTGKISFDPHDIFLEDIIVKNRLFIQPVADRKTILVTSKCDEGLRLFSDANIINTILRNLLSNAIKFTKVGGEISIIGTKNEEGRVILSVEDTGIGMSNDRINKLFSGISQNSTQGTQNEKGSGLGLSLVQDLCKMIGADIQAESRLKEGTKFSIVFKAEKNT